MSDGADALKSALARARSGSAAPQLDDESFRGLRELIVEQSGISFDNRSRFIVERRLLPRLRALRLDNYGDYYRYLLYGPDAEQERERLLEAVTIRETYFFREWPQLEALRDDLLPRIARENAASGRLRIWSAGCASGEEPFSVAMLVLETRLFDGWTVEILGSDLVPQALDAARRGVYREAAMRATPDPLRERYFADIGGGLLQLDERVSRMVEFRTLNLLDTGTYPNDDRFDAVLCRNVLIYFGDETRRRVVHGFHDRLRDGGVLLLGHAESLLTLSTPFTLRHVGRDMVYER